MTTVKQVVEAFREAGKEEEKAAETLRGIMAGLPLAKREERIKAIYTEARTIAGVVTPARELDKYNSRVYGRIREAYSRLFSTKRGAKRGSKARKATVTKVVGVAKSQVKVIATKPKKLSDTLKVILATIQVQEKPQYKDVPKLIAALQVCIDLAV